MKKQLMRMLLALPLVLLLAVSARAADVNLSAAASLTDAVTELSGAFAKKHTDVTFRRNFGGSGSVAKQIENGAPADLFFSANVKWMDYLKEKKLVVEKSVIVLAYNEVVFVGRPELKVSELQDVVKIDKIAIGSPKSVPAGDYAMQALTKAGLDKKLKGKLVMARDVRQCLLYADRGEVDGAFVYKTDALEMAKHVKILFTVPQDLYRRVTYPMALTPSGDSKPEAVAFFKFLTSGEARDILVKHGFAIR